MASAAGGAKVKHTYICRECHEEQAQWTGKCPSCDAWHTLEKVAVSSSATEGGGGSGARAAAKFGQNLQRPGGAQARATALHAPRRGQWVDEADAPIRLSELSQRGFQAGWRWELPGGVGAELNRVLGGGVVPGSVTLLGGAPGVGKSTLLLQVAALLAQAGVADGPSATDPGAAPGSGSDNRDHRPVLYVSGEESVEQIGSRSERMQLGPASEGIFLYSATRLDSILDQMARLSARAVIVDSIQTVYLDEIPSSAGNITQLRECTTALLRVAKRQHIPIFLVGHLTKSGDIAGPRVLEHIVDVVLYMEGDGQSPVRLVPGATWSGSLLLNGSLLARFAPPLCYNFLHVIRMNEYMRDGQSMVFIDKMGSAFQDIPVLGQSFNTWFPLALVVYVALLTFNLWEKCASKFLIPAATRFDVERADDEHSSKGQRLVAAEQEALLAGGVLGDGTGLHGVGAAADAAAVAAGGAMGGRRARGGFGQRESSMRLNTASNSADPKHSLGLDASGSRGTSLELSASTGRRQQDDRIDDLFHSIGGRRSHNGPWE